MRGMLITPHATLMRRLEVKKEQWWKLPVLRQLVLKVICLAGIQECRCSTATLDYH